VIVADLPRDLCNTATPVHWWFHTFQWLEHLSPHIAVLRELGLGVCVTSTDFYEEFYEALSATLKNTHSATVLWTMDLSQSPASAPFERDGDPPARPQASATGAEPGARQGLCCRHAW
jgi:hypothetical protein